MKRKILTLSFLLLLILNCLGQIEATTAEGKEVILYVNGTWKYADQNSQKEVNYNLCESLFERFENPDNGEITIKLVDEIIVFNGIEGFSIGISKSLEALIVTSKVVSTTNCIEDNAKINITFQDESILSLTSTTKSNCNGIVEIDFLGIHGMKDELGLLSSMEIKSIKIWRKDGYVEKELTKSQSERLLNAFSCANMTGAVL